MPRELSVLPLSAMTISAFRPCAAIAALALAMQAGSVVASLRQGMTMETSTGWSSGVGWGAPWPSLLMAMNRATGRSWASFRDMPLLGRLADGPALIRRDGGDRPANPGFLRLLFRALLRR